MIIIYRCLNFNSRKHMITVIVVFKVDLSGRGITGITVRDAYRLNEITGSIE